MFEGFSQRTIDFLWDIRFYNEKNWFLEHKQEYQTLLAIPMKELAWEVYDSFCNQFQDLGLEPHVARIYRDARRTHGRGPYKDHLWFTLRPSIAGPWSDKPVFWFELAPEDWSYGLGYYCARPSTMAKLRARIDKRPQDLAKLARILEKQNEFKLDGASYARPKGDPGPLLRDWYNKKSFALIHTEPTGPSIFSPSLVPRLVQGYTFLVPYYQYFTTLDSDPDPQ